jgi:uncharacterized protein involved in response to NO
MEAARRATYLERCKEEPFRIFFPLGVLFGISGVSLWPLYFSGLHKFYPGTMHARMMIEGFMGAFVLGFLGTAGPKFTDTAPFSGKELAVNLALLLTTVGLQIAERYVLGDAVFTLLLLCFAGRLGWRFNQRTDLPPPTFVLFAFGFVTAIIGSVLLVTTQMFNGSMYALVLGTQLLNQGFILYLILGGSGFLLSRLSSLPRQPEPECGRAPTREWKRRARFAAAIATGILASFAVDIFAEAPRLAGLMRFVAVAVFLAIEISTLHASEPPEATNSSSRRALIFILLGLLFPVLWPWQRVAGLHLIFIGGYTLIAFTVATWVVLGHSGQGRLLSKPLPFLRGTALLLAAAAIFRAIGDFFPVHRAMLLDLAGCLWMLAAAWWGWRVLLKGTPPSDRACVATITG